VPLRSGRAAPGFVFASANVLKSLFEHIREHLDKKDRWRTILVALLLTVITISEHLVPPSVCLSFQQWPQGSAAARFARRTLRIPHTFHQLSLVAIHIKPLRGLTGFAFPCSPPSPLF